jgi:hypothetical protein
MESTPAQRGDPDRRQPQPGQLGRADVDALHRLLGGVHIGRRVRVDLLRGTLKMDIDLVPALRG